jgi:hypothetical protein
MLETSHNVKMTSAEIANLWSQYMNDSMAICINNYMLDKLEDPAIRSVFHYALDLSKNHVQRIKEIFNQENHPIPHGFTDEDVNLKAAKLYSDAFCLKYIHEMTIHGLTGYALALTTSSRADIRQFYVECNASAMELYNKTTEVLLSKGLYLRPPYISTPEKNDFVKAQNFLTGWFGERRPLSAIEISNTSFNLKKNIMAKALILGFSQIATSEEIRNFMVRGYEIKQKHNEIFSSVLSEDNLPSLPLLDSEVTNSTVAPLSDKLMMYHTGFLFQTALADYGTALATSSRTDLAAQYSRTITEDLKIVEDWANIMIHNEWMEQPPQADDRKALANAKMS